MATRKTTTTTTTTRESRVRSRAGEAPEKVVVVEEGGMGFADVLTIVTAVLLIAAWVMMDKVRGEHFGTGMFFKP